MSGAPFRDGSLQFERSMQSAVARIETAIKAEAVKPADNLEQLGQSAEWRRDKAFRGICGARPRYRSTR
jgi:hypothetical protein